VSDRLFRCSFPYLRVEDERDAAISFQTSEVVLYVFLVAGLERRAFATRVDGRVGWPIETFGEG
jgi:hypothetical protein